MPSFLYGIEDRKSVVYGKNLKISIRRINKKNFKKKKKNPRKIRILDETQRHLAPDKTKLAHRAIFFFSQIDMTEAEPGHSETKKEKCKK